MFIDLFSNNMSYNPKLAKILGVKTAIYIASLYTFLNKDNRNTEEDFFPINRPYITNLSGLTKEDQLNAERVAKDLELIELNNSKDRIKLNPQPILNLICEENEDLINNIKSNIKQIKTIETKKTQKQIICENLKNNIICSNEELLEAYKGWIDGVYANPNGFLSKKSIEIFQNNINDYTNGDLDLALKIIEIATVSGYRDANWAIDNYEKRNPKPKPKLGRPKLQTIKPIINNEEVF